MPLSKTTKLWLLFVAAFIMMMLSFGMCVEPSYAQETVVVSVKDFGKGMTPVLPVWRNDPEALVYSQNMFSTQPGGRQLRFGYSIFTDTFTVDSGHITSALALFQPAQDSGAIVYTSNGKWYGNTVGERRWAGSRNPGFDWNAAFADAAQIRPFNGGDSIGLASDSVIGFGTRFVRDLQPGDTITSSGESKVVDYIVSDTKLFTTASWSADTATYVVARAHDSLVTPFLYQSGDLLYTGTVADPPQIIYTKDDTLRIRPMGIVDSFYIDSIYTKYPPDTSDWDDDSTYGGRRSWDTTAGAKEYYKEFQLVSRRKPGQWSINQWVENLNNSPEAYYVRIGFENKTVFYPIVANSDTSIYLMTWYVDTLSLGASGASWNDSLYFGVGTDIDDLPAAAAAESTWGYIYSSAGFSKVVVADENTNAVAIRGRGALFYLEDASFPIDSTEFYKGMHFIHLTGDDINFPKYIDEASKLIRDRYEPRELSEPVLQADLPDGDTVRSSTPIFWCDNIYKNYPTLDEAEEHCHFGETVTEGKMWRITTTRTDQLTKEAEAIGNAYFPIRYASHINDTIFFVTSIGTDLTDITEITTSNWEIVKVGMPNFSGMAEWNTPPQLVGWGDSTSPSLLSFSGVNDPWNWSATSDVLVGNDPSSPIVSVYGYDDQLVVFKSSSMLGFDGNRFTELSQTDGLAAPRAVVGLTKELYWLDVDGVKKMARRDFSGYSIQKISSAMDPVFNSWRPQDFGTDVVPIRLTPQYRNNAIMTYNQRDRHLYLFGTFSEATNNACLTYGVETGLWDGYFTIPATAAIWASVRDTSRILIGSPDSATVFGLDYAYLDHVTGIDLDLLSAKFQIEDNGWPVKSKLKAVWFNGRGASNLLDSARIFIIGENATDTFDITFGVSIGDVGQTYYSSKDNLSKYWQWQIEAFGTDSTGTLFQPHELRMEFIPVAREH